MWTYYLEKIGDVICACSAVVLIIVGLISTASPLWEEDITVENCAVTIVNADAVSVSKNSTTREYYVDLSVQLPNEEVALISVKDEKVYLYAHDSVGQSFSTDIIKKAGWCFGTYIKYEVEPEDVIHAFNALQQD